MVSATSTPPARHLLVAAFVSLVVPAGLALVRWLETGAGATYLYVGLSSMAMMTGCAWVLARRGARDRRLSVTDSLTGLYNRRHFATQLLTEMKHDRRRGLTTCVMCVDVDSLKALNDHYGHDAGDAALVEVAALLSRGVRSRDVVARFGGDEFAVLLPDTSGIDAIAIGQRILDEAKLSAKAMRGGLSLSIGIAELEATATSAQVLAAADRALYWVKHSGGGRVSLAPRAVIGAIALAAP